MANGWTPERRARQAALIRTWRPWERSTGPKTEAGKAMVAKNAYKHGGRSGEWVAERRRLIELMRDFRDFCEEVAG